MPSAKKRRGAVVVASAWVVVIVVLVATALIRRDDASPDGSELPDATEVGHVHGLGTDPADGTVYVAAHYGVFRIDADGGLQRVADRWQDTMAFTVVGPRHFVASGHPDPAEDQPSSLGLIESRDAALTWKSLSLAGEADFHALEAGADRTWGYDSVSGQLLTSTDQRQWDAVAASQVVDLAADPDDPDRVLATTPTGTLVGYRADGSEPETVAAPAMFLVDWPEADLLVGIGADGALQRSDDAGRTWTSAGRAPGEPHALEITEDAWHVASSSGLYVSNDQGSTWNNVFTYDNDGA
jgi:hypothetical protein